MINGFETITYELTEYEEHKILPLIIAGLKTKKGAAAAMKNNKMCQILKAEPWSLKISEARIRKIINFIRANGLINNLIATSKGYYIAQTQEEVQEYIESLNQRANAILTIKYALQNQCADF